VIISTVIGLIEDWTKMKNDKQALEQQNTQAELALLKSQLNPHFLFNTLNSIYSLAYQKSDKAPDAILKLSEVMRYMLYDSEGKVVLLEKELQYLHSFVDLQKARFKENIYVDLLVEGRITNQLIMPVLLIAFVENAFKHGVLNDPADPVLIHVMVEEDHLQLHVQNRINHQLKDQTGGIGLPNIYRRLELLYPGQYKLNIKENDTHYICELSLQL
jgi:LytS/YehU family sensor histidine kinase